MRALVVYESMFGNTRTIAEAVAEGLRGSDVEVEVSEVGVAPVRPDDDVALLVVGAPTHALSLSRPESRRSAAEQADGPLVSTGIGLREWLAALPRGTIVTAAFDTHVDRKVPGAASRAAQKRLRKRGYRVALPAESFYVSDLAGPLVAGEVDRARRWGAALADVGAVTRDASGRELGQSPGSGTREGSCTGRPVSSWDGAQLSRQPPVPRRAAARLVGGEASGRG